MSHYGRGGDSHYGGGGGGYRDDRRGGRDDRGGGGYYEDRRGGGRRDDRRGRDEGGRNWRDRHLGNAKGGAEHLARIHGTEEDKVNCPFYFKIGACRHGERCSRKHNKPPFSQTLLLKHMYKNPASALFAPPARGERAAPQGAHDATNTAGLEEFEDFYEEVFEELTKFGQLEEMHVCDNLGEHMIGNVYAKYADEEEADAARTGLNGRYYAGMLLEVEFSPVTDFREARCRQYDEGQCTYGPYCNFLHVKTISRSLRRELARNARKARREGGDRSRSRSPSGSRSRRSRSKDKKERDEDGGEGGKEENGGGGGGEAEEGGAGKEVKVEGGGEENGEGEKTKAAEEQEGDN